MAKIVVVGSSNTDMVVKAEQIPAPGETVLGGEFMTAGGGKGANQAVAAARLGADVTFVARVGRDQFGDSAVDGFEKEGIRTEFVTRDEDARSGVALICVDRHGENAIVVAPGANSRLTPEHVRGAVEAIRQADVLLLQLEIPVDSVLAAAEMAKQAGATVILNPAPARDIPDSLLEMVDVITPNETEAAMLAGLASTGGMPPGDIGRRLAAKSACDVVLTLGAKGAEVISKDEAYLLDAVKVEPVDTTGAGDSFNGALAVALAEGKGLSEAVKFAIKAAAITVTRVGAQPSLPTRAEVEAMGF